MEYFLGFIPIGRASDAYGYAQAKTMTWDDYVRETGNNCRACSDSWWCYGFYGLVYQQNP